LECQFTDWRHYTEALTVGGKALLNNGD